RKWLSTPTISIIEINEPISTTPAGHVFVTIFINGDDEKCFLIFLSYKGDESCTTRCEMSTQVTRKIYAILFFSIFFAKMLISSAPIFVNDFDRQALLRVVLQLEIENNNGKSGLGDQAKELFTKFYAKDLTFLQS